MLPPTLIDTLCCYIILFSLYYIYIILFFFFWAFRFHLIVENIVLQGNLPLPRENCSLKYNWRKGEKKKQQEFQWGGSTAGSRPAGSDPVLKTAVVTSVFPQIGSKMGRRRRCCFSKGTLGIVPFLSVTHTRTHEKKSVLFVSFCVNLIHDESRLATSKQTKTHTQREYEKAFNYVVMIHELLTSECFVACHT